MILSNMRAKRIGENCKIYLGNILGTTSNISIKDLIKLVSDIHYGVDTQESTTHYEEEYDLAKRYIKVALVYGLSSEALILSGIDCKMTVSKKDGKSWAILKEESLVVDSNFVNTLIDPDINGKNAGTVKCKINYCNTKFGKIVSGITTSNSEKKLEATFGYTKAILVEAEDIIALAKKEGY